MFKVTVESNVEVFEKDYPLLAAVNRAARSKHRSMSISKTNFDSYGIKWCTLCIN